ncbi:MAG TPA: hypothetical protein VLT47_01375 [Anaeromyxobacteraceae bacterium]|nr:hypothetical protein [Anaeromyxobacteraceae bacterium]
MHTIKLLLAIPLLAAGCATTGETAAGAGAAPAAGSAQGGSAVTSTAIPFALKCAHNGLGYCDEYVGTFAATDATAATTTCLVGGGKFGALTCPETNRLAGHCVLDPVDFGTGTTGKRYYDATKFDAARAQADCTSLGKKWGTTP